jgi:hypothetical protein
MKETNTGLQLRPDPYNGKCGIHSGNLTFPHRLDKHIHCTHRAAIFWGCVWSTVVLSDPLKNILLIMASHKAMRISNIRSSKNTAKYRPSHLKHSIF